MTEKTGLDIRFLQLMSSEIGGHQVSFLGRGGLGQVTAVTSQRGAVKGYVANPACDPPLNAAGKVSLSPAIASPAFGWGQLLTVSCD